ncbi:Helix-turn-helix domain protein [compost metagenome]
MGTNMRYASYILQKFRGKDFYDYLQSSRVEYIIGKLKTSPELFDYKISFLAEMSGFTSLSRFSSAFKEVTGIPPSAFIHFMKKEIDQKK